MGNKQKILLVEDEQSLREALKLNLELDGYDVDVAENGSKAVNMFNAAFYKFSMGTTTKSWIGFEWWRCQRDCPYWSIKSH